MPVPSNPGGDRPRGQRGVRQRLGIQHHHLARDQALDIEEFKNATSFTLEPVFETAAAANEPAQVDLEDAIAAAEPGNPLDRAPAAFELKSECKQYGTTVTAVAKRMGMSASLLDRELRNSNLPPAAVRGLNIILAEIEEGHSKHFPRRPTYRLLAYRASLA